jgi:integrase
VNTKARYANGYANQVANMAEAEAAPPGVYRVSGATGLYLKKGETGAGSWVYRYWLGGRRQAMGLGSLDDVKLAAAKVEVKRLAVLRDNGVDPLAEKRGRKAANLAESRKPAKDTFIEAAESFRDENAQHWKHKYAAQNWISPLVHWAFPVIGHMPLDEIEIEHVRACINAASAKGRPETARRVRQRIETVLDDATAKGRRSATARNPADAKLHAILGRKRGERPHYRRIELDSAPAVFRTLLSGAQDSTSLAAWAFMIATAARPSEALAAQWSEINLKRKLWTVPAARMKNNRTHVVPLSSLALRILERQAKVRTSNVVFPGSSGSTCSYEAFATAAKDAGTPHSWRSVFRDACGDRLRVDRDLAEAALSHTVGGVEGAYRRETAIEARRPVMEAYAAWLLDDGANVITFPARA